MSKTDEAARLFPPFLDPVDMVMSCAANASLADVNLKAGSCGLRFPLVCDPASSLEAHVSAIDYAPSSARFGPYVDNVLGMNWELASGRIVRVGERVIKSTTGYDLLRFLLHSDGRYGRAHDYVLRLRPLGGSRARAVFRGENDAMEQVRAALLRSVWIHWLDAVSLHVSSTGDSAIEVEADCIDGEQAIFAEFFAMIGRETGTTWAPQSMNHPGGLPALSIKTTVPKAPGVARRLVCANGGEARVLCVNGVVHYYPPSDQLPPAILEELSAECTRDGGHMMGPWAGTSQPDEQEAAWATMLETTWKQL